MLFPDLARQHPPDFVRLAKDVRTGRYFAYLFVLDTAKLKAAFIGDFDPLEKPRDTPSRPFKPSALSAYKNDPTRALTLDQANEAVMPWHSGEISRSKTIAAINEQLGLGRDRVEIDRGTEKQAVAVHKFAVQRSYGIVNETELRGRSFAARLAARYVKF
jgi:hypothetical protein